MTAVLFVVDVRTAIPAPDKCLNSAIGEISSAVGVREGFVEEVTMDLGL